MAQDADLTPVGYDTLAGWAADDHLAAFHAYRTSAGELVTGRYHHRPLGPDIGAAKTVAQAAVSANVNDKAAARAFLRTLVSNLIALNDRAF